MIRKSEYLSFSAETNKRMVLETIMGFLVLICGTSIALGQNQSIVRHETAGVISLIPGSDRGFITLPLHLGTLDATGQQVLFIITDASDGAFATTFGAIRADSLAVAPQSSVEGAVFANGTWTFFEDPGQVAHVDVNDENGNGNVTEILGPTGNPNYSPLKRFAWNGKVVTANLPFIKWGDGPGQQLIIDLGGIDPLIRSNPPSPLSVWDGPPGANAANEGPLDRYKGGQVIALDLQAMTVTLKLHRGTFHHPTRLPYYIVLDASKGAAAAGMGVIHSPKTANLGRFGSNAAVGRIAQFANGVPIPSGGPARFQQGLASYVGGQSGLYTPMWHVTFIFFDCNGNGIFFLPDQNVGEGAVATAGSGIPGFDPADPATFDPFGMDDKGVPCAAMAAEVAGTADGFILNLNHLDALIADGFVIETEAPAGLRLNNPLQPPLIVNCPMPLTVLLGVAGNPAPPLVPPPPPPFPPPPPPPPPAPLPPSAPTTAMKAPIIGTIEALVIDDPTDVWSGGLMLIGGRTVIIPRNMIIELPATFMTLQQIFAQAPPDCVAVGESGLATWDTCLSGAACGVATVLANRTSAGDIIAGDIFLEKGQETITGTVTFIDTTDGYFRLNGQIGDPASGIMVRINDPESRHTIQQGLGCNGGPNCSPDPRFTIDSDNYTVTYSTGYPACIPSSVIGGNRTTGSDATGNGDMFCPASNRGVNPVPDSTRFAPIQLGDSLTAKGNFEFINGVDFISAHTVFVNVALTTLDIPSQPDYMILDETEWDVPGFQNERVRLKVIGFTTLGESQLDIFSLHVDPTTNENHEVPLGSTVGDGRTIFQGIPGAGPAINEGGSIFRIRYDVDFLKGLLPKPLLSPCTNLTRAGFPVCLRGGTLDEEFAVLSPVTREMIARSRHKLTLSPGVVSFDINGNPAPNGEYLIPVDLTHPEFVEINLNRLDTPFIFSGLPWNLDRRLSPGGCIDIDGDGILDCETIPQPLTPFPFSGLDPRGQALIPPLARDRIISFFNAGIPASVLLDWPPPNPPFIGATIVAPPAPTGPNAPPPPTLVANAGPDQIATPGVLVQLDAGATLGQVTGFTFLQTAGPTVTLSDPNIPNPTFVFPMAAVGTAVTFQLTATGPDGTATDTITVNCGPDPTPPPVAVAVVAQITQVASDPFDPPLFPTLQVQLSGANSQGQISNFQWVQTGGPSVTLGQLQPDGTLVPDATTSSPTFMATPPAGVTRYNFDLTVTGPGGTANNPVSVALFSVPQFVLPPQVAPRSLKTVPAPSPTNLTEFVKDTGAAITLGKALFWDMQVGGDGIQACATCHHHAGADGRFRNEIRPGPSGSFGPGGPNFAVQPDNFPFHKLSIPSDRDSIVLSDTDAIFGSQGVVRADFLGIAPTMAVDNAVPVVDSLFQVSGINVRQVTGRNAPSVINAVYNHRNFWDGRANEIFNGFSPFGERDPSGPVILEVQQSGAVIPIVVRIDTSSLASQAVGPPNNGTEMSLNGRTFPELGRKLLHLRPLNQQFVDPQDSVLGVFARQPGRGLNTTYRDLIQAAFWERFWDSPQYTADGFSIMENNFSLFFGLAIQLYESTLVADDTPFDRFMEGNKMALTDSQKRGLGIFLNQGRCIQCHGGPEFTKASVFNVSQKKVERMIMHDLQPAAYDNGFYNIGVRPTSEDPGVGGTDPFGQPIAFTRLAKLGIEIGALQRNLPIDASEREALDGSFKVPGLRNVELTGPYMHNGGMATLEQVVEFYNRGGDFHDTNIHNLDLDIQPLSLGSQGRADLVAFLKALTDDRVRLQKAPFDHPQLFVPNGETGDNTSVSLRGSSVPVDLLVEIPAVGATGGPAVQPFVQPAPMDGTAALFVIGQDQPGLGSCCDDLGGCSMTTAVDCATGTWMEGEVCSGDFCLVPIACFAVNEVKIGTKDARCQGLSFLEMTSTVGTEQRVSVFVPDSGQAVLANSTVVDDGVNGPVTIDTSCGQPIKIGDAHGAYTVTDLIQIFDTAVDSRGNDVEVRITFKPTLTIDPVADDIAITLDDGQSHALVFYIPAGSFQIDGKPEKQKYKFRTPAGSAMEVKAKLELRRRRFSIKAQSPLNCNLIAGTTLTVGFQIGANVGQEVITMVDKNNHLEHKKEPKLECASSCTGIAFMQLTSDQGVLVFEPAVGSDRLSASIVVDDGVNGPVTVDTTCSQPMDVGDSYGSYTISELVKTFMQQQ